jgi:radical SAM protein with 4Fe4S-binding SPASM domain
MIERIFPDIVVPLQSFLRYERRDIFTSVAIETTSWCNRKCSYCPSGKYKRKNKRLDLPSILNVFKQLGAIRFNGTIYIHLFNEPLFDKRLPYIIDYARKKCPESRIFISSNGDRLTTHLMKLLIEAGLDLLYVTQYDGQINDNVREVQESLIESDQIGYLSVRVQNVFENNRGGTLDFMKINEPLRELCYRPGRMLVINSDGKVLLCCNDYLGREVMGDIRKEGILNIWSNEKFRHFRNSLINKDRTVSPLCSACNEVIDSRYGPLVELSKTKGFKIFNELGLVS